MNYLQLCQALVQELEVSGGSGPSSTLNQTDPDLINIINWIAWSNDYINNLHLDWKFLWVRFTGQNLSIGSDVAPQPTGGAMAARVVDQRSCWLNYGTAQPQRLRFWPWETARDRWAYAKITQRPTAITRRPDGTLELNYLAAFADAVQYDYWGVPKALNDGTSGQDSNTPLLPADFHRLIVVRAKIMYAEHEDAPEVMSGAAAEYSDLLAKLEAAYWPRQEWGTMSHDNAPDMQFSSSPGGNLDIYGGDGYP